MNLITLTHPRAPAAEAYRTLRTNLLFSNVDTPPRKIVFVSPSQEENQSITLANLAVTLAQSDHPTLIVDADLRRPSQHSLWDRDNGQGLTDMIIDVDAFQNPPIQPTEVEGLRVLTSGKLPPNPADVLASRRMDEVIARLAEEAEYILFDAPPILAVTDAAVLSRKVDGVLLVVKAGTTRRDQTTRAKEQLERVQANLIGVVLTNAPRSSSGY
jgi:non-specific protein-tyrosine kinase